MLSIIACFLEVSIVKVSTYFSNASQHLYFYVICMKMAYRYD